jgi:hypothetical protein
MRRALECCSIVRKVTARYHSTMLMIVPRIERIFFHVMGRSEHGSGGLHCSKVIRVAIGEFQKVHSQRYQVQRNWG